VELVRSLIESFFSVTVHVEVAGPEASREPLLPEEEAAVRGAGPTRRRDFVLGRTCAHRALERLGLERQPVLRGEGGAPIWPDGVVGTVSHCGGVAAAAVARSGDVAALGLDLEAAVPLSAELRTYVCGPRELERAQPLGSPPVGDWEKLIFSAKESVFKCHFPVGGRFLEFSDIEIEVASAGRRFLARVAGDPRPIEGYYGWANGSVVTGALIPRAPRAGARRRAPRSRG
jgi:4'-phosphopantetheinyl transferase EntD